MSRDWLARIERVTSSAWRRVRVAWGRLCEQPPPWLRDVLPRRSQLFALALAAIVGVAIAWTVWATLPAPATSITVVLAAARPTSATPVPATARALAPLATPLIAAATPTTTVPTDPPQSPTPSPTERSSEDLAWSRLQPELDAAWGTDTPRAIALLTAFLAESPEHPAAREKLYAALLSEADRLVDGEQADQAIARLERATELLPARAEAQAALVALTPAASEASAPKPAPVAIRPPPPPARVAPAPAPPSAPPEAPPTPTKVPFRP